MALWMIPQGLPLVTTNRNRSRIREVNWHPELQIQSPSPKPHLLHDLNPTAGIFISLRKGPKSPDFYAHYYHSWGYGVIMHTPGIFTRTAGVPQAAGASIGSCLMAGKRVVPLTRRKRRGGVAAKAQTMRQPRASGRSR